MPPTKLRTRRWKELLFGPARVMQPAVGFARWLRPAAITFALALAVMAGLVGAGVLNFRTHPATTLMVAGVESERGHPALAVSAALNPQISSAMAALNEEEIDELQTHIVNALLPENVSVPALEPNPVMEEPSFADLNTTEITELAKALHQHSFDWAI